MKKIKNLAKVSLSAIMAAMCLQSSAFAADLTQVRNNSTFVNKGGYVGNYIDVSSTENIVTNMGRSDNLTTIDNKDIMVNLEGYIGNIVKAGDIINIVTTLGSDSATLIDNSKETYNISGIIDTYIDTSNVYNDILNRR